MVNRTFELCVAKALREENQDYDYLKQLFRHLRTELSIQVAHQDKKLPCVPTEEEIRKYYEAVWKSRNMKHVLLIKTFKLECLSIKTKLNPFALCRKLLINASRIAYAELQQFQTAA